MIFTYKIQIKGIVQGVGFRPFVYGLALKYNIRGWVNNDDRGVNILVNSSKKSYQDFLEELKTNPPKLARIDKILANEIATKKKYTKFEIKKSESKHTKSTVISPDMAVCDECIKDINDKNNFRYNYALTNCTNCGPRYSIIKTVPYDRVNTSMSEFKLCKKCEQEYKNPLNRRYHAQPIACEKCGPSISLYDKNKKLLSKNIQAIEQIAHFINQGKIVAIKGLGGFHLVCDSTNNEVIKKLREKKQRPNKPFAVMFKDMKSLKEHTKVSKKEEELLGSIKKPIVLVKKSKTSTLSKLLAPKISHLGVFLAYTPLHHLLFRYLKNPIVATSANLKGEPIIKSCDEIIENLSNIIDFVLDFNRDIINACDDSILQVIKNNAFILRNARGYAPNTLKLENKVSKSILCLGASQKSTISLVFEDNLILSPYIGTLDSIKSMQYFENTIKTFKRFYNFSPQIIVCDKHPKYLSTQFALKLKEDNPTMKLIQIQHHYAHTLATMAEHKLKKDVLAFCFDGTGYGDDGNIWGGEVFICNKKEYKRIHHIKYFKLLGGELAIKEPRRIALSLLFDNFTLEEILNLKIELIKTFTKQEIRVLYQMWQKNLNSPKTSSIGRLFDAIASFCNLCHIQDFEGQTGLYIEEYYNKNIKGFYPFKLDAENIDISPMIKEIVKDEDKEIICTKFINTLIEIMIQISKKNKNLDIVISGGVFQNKVFLALILDEFEKEKRKVHFPSLIPLNDSSISIGQAYFVS